MVNGDEHVTDVKMDLPTGLLVSAETTNQLHDLYGGEGKTLSITFVHPTINKGFLLELIVQSEVHGYKSVNAYICLIDPDGRVGSTVRETL